MTIGLVIDGVRVWKCDSAICPEVARREIIGAGFARYLCTGCATWLERVLTQRGLALITRPLDMPRSGEREARAAFDRIPA